MKYAFPTILLFLATTAIASNKHRVFEMQSMLESRIGAIVKAMDPSAVVIVHLKTSARGDAQLPGTPFIMEDITVQDADGDPQIQSVDLQILTESKLSPTVSKLITEIGSQVGPVNLRVEKLPPELKMKPPPAPESVDEVDDESEVAAAPVAPPPPQKIIVQMVEPPKAASNLPPWAEKLFPFFVAGLGLLLAGAASVIALMLGRGSKRLAGIVQTGFTDLASVFSYSSGGAAHEGEKASLESAGVMHAVAAAASASASGAPSALDELSEEGLLSLISDCYWSDLDSYAAYLWRRLPLHRRKSLLAVAGFLAEYANYLVGVKEENLAVEHEPCYLAPLPIWHLNNNVISEMLREEAGLRFHLSSIRMAHTNLSSRERLTVNAASERLIDLPGFDKIAPSPKRTLRMRQEIPIRTIEEEREIIGLQNLSLEAMESIPTLAWLLKMPPTTLAHEFTRFSARELASAWIGPEEVLSELEKQLPDKKRDLLKSYRTQVTPQRSSPTFHALRHAAVDFLHSPESLAA